jgi:cytochrome b pre-mRNA-processing protein 3
MFRLFRPPPQAGVADALYRVIVEQARAPSFYVACGVPDTPDGRYDMIVAHAVLVFRRLHSSPEETRDLAQALFDLMFADMDQNLREMGVGDLAVGKRVKGMAKAFYGRLAAYDGALTSGDAAALHATLLRNVYRKAQPAEHQVKLLAGYLRRESDRLKAQPLSELLEGGLRFGIAPSVSVEE